MKEKISNFLLLFYLPLPLHVLVLLFIENM